MTVADLMVHKVITVEPGERLFDAVLIMNENHVRHLPVVDQGRLVGIITNRDIRFLANEVSAEDRDRGNYTLSLNNRVVDIMEKHPIVTGADVPLNEILDVFLDEKIGAVPVVDEQDCLLGIIGYIDLLKVLRDRL
ncbi:MAG: CBS domain-containing protein [Candidatus Latescibacteria bacterium]|nr:CBS domain-containing protein [Candidatus Latescibacterota bacterium]